MKDYNEKQLQLMEIMDQYTNNDIIIAFSGGVDSSLLLKIACEKAKEKGSNVYAVTIHTKLHPMNDLDNARKVAIESGAIHEVLHVDELSEAGIGNNPEDRCYLCKKCLFQKLLDMAKEKNIDHVLEGTNEDDLHVYRPGLKALKELGVKSPLAQVQITKAEVRKMAENYGLSVANRPSAPCLATRFPYGTELSYDVMRQIEKAEDYIRSFGFYNVRVRVHQDIARIEVDDRDLEKLLQERANIISFMKNIGFCYITIDLEGFRSGSMDINVKI